MNYVPPEVILIVDDNPINLEALGQILKKAGFEVLVADSGQRAIEQAQVAQPNLVLLDATMPGMDGFETCRQLKALEITQTIPIIFMTALAAGPNQIQALSLGAVDYITKPFYEAEVLAKLETHLRLQRLTQQLQAQNLRLQEFTTELETRVAARTAELTTALKELQQAQAMLLKKEAQLRHDVCHDRLTGLPNRVWLMARLEHLIQHTAQHPEFLYAVLFFDLDHFKALNDSRGHLVGDELLQQVSQRLSACLRSTDTITRFGGDEFVILLEDLETVEVAIAMAQQIQAELTHSFQLGDEEAFTSASIGITLSTENYQRPEDILRDADAAMYHAKHCGKRRFEIFTPAMQTRVQEQLQLENDLRRAIADRSLCLYYQPIFSLGQKHLVGLEALVRWQHPVKGLLQPDEFIPLAETAGLIDDLETWVFSTACWQLSQWKRQFPDNPDLMLNVNLSAAQLQHRDLLGHIDAVLAETGLPGHCLNFELTESCTLDLSADKAQLLKQLRSRGIKLCIDDFGVGYSSLSRLHDLPIDALKIDRSFIDNLGENAKSREVVATIVTLSRCLNLDVIAEGIETTTQLEQLQDLNCTFGQGTLELGQGFLFSPPLTPMKITQFLKKTD